MNSNNKNQTANHREGVLPDPRREPLHGSTLKRRGPYRATPTRDMRLEAPDVEIRLKLRLAEIDPLPHEKALELIPNLSVHQYSELPVEHQHIAHVRSDGYGEWSGLAYRMPENGSRHIIFNDAHDLQTIRVTLMEEFFHLYLDHPTETLRLYPAHGSHRTYNHAKEREAYHCAIAALVPEFGLAASLRELTYTSRIAEHFNVPISVVEERIGATSLGHLSNQMMQQQRLWD